MNSQRAFVRKIIYLVAIVLLLGPLFLLGHPATSATKAGKGATAAGWPSCVKRSTSPPPMSARST